MKTAVNIDLVNNIVMLNDGSQKTIDNYILELEDRLIKIYNELKDYDDVVPNNEYLVSGETMFKVMDIIEDRK